MEPAEKRASQPWWVWTSIWAGVVLSLFTVMMMMIMMVVVVVDQSPHLRHIHYNSKHPGDLVGFADGRGLAKSETTSCSGERSSLSRLHLAHHQHPHHFACHSCPSSGLCSWGSDDICMIKTKFPGGVPSGAMLGLVGDCDGGGPTCSLLCLIFYSAQVLTILEKNVRL